MKANLIRSWPSSLLKQPLALVFLNWKYLKHVHSRIFTNKCDWTFFSWIVLKQIGTALSKLRKLLWNIKKLIDSNTRKAVCSPELLGVYCRTSKYSSNIESDVVILLSSDVYLKTLTRPSKYSICACMFYLGTGRKPLFCMKNHKKKKFKSHVRWRH